MGALVKSILLATLILSTILCISAESHTLDHTIYDNRTLSRYRRQSEGQSCKGDASKFQCATTADCIDVYLECDGKEDCPDGSDENESLCKDFAEKCRTPKQPAHGQWVDSYNITKGAPNVPIDVFSVIIFSCDEGYKLSATEEATLPMLCLLSVEWSIKVMPTCQKLCSAVYNSSLITVSCKNDDSYVRCDQATDNTVLTYKCAPYYEPPHGVSKQNICYDGSWQYNTQCIPVCGEKRVSATPLIINGKEVERGHYPWVVALYSSKDSDPDYTHICGGSLIATDIVLTAAQCVTKTENGQVYPLKNYRVGAGKYYNIYKDPRDSDTAQYAEVVKVEVTREYRGEILDFLGNIALLKLKNPLALSEVVQPICYNNPPPLIPNTYGVVTGWGYTTTTGQPSEKLKELELPYETKCFNEFDRSLAMRYFTMDKMCAGFTDQNEFNYNELFEVIKTILILSHGNATVESGFSVNSQMLVENMHERSMMARRQIYDAICHHGGPEKIEITKKIKTYFGSAYMKYKRYLESQKKEKIKEQREKEENRKAVAEIAILEKKKSRLAKNTAYERSFIDEKVEVLRKKL